MPRDGPMMSATCSKSLLAHEACHPFARDADGLIAHFSMNTWTARHLSTGMRDSVNVLSELLILSLMVTQRTLLPGIVAAQGDSQRLTQHTDGILLSLRFHDLVPHSWPCEKILTVFLSMSRSCRVRSSSRLRRRFSSSNAVW